MAHRIDPKFRMYFAKIRLPGEVVFMTLRGDNMDDAVADFDDWYKDNQDFIYEEIPGVDYERGRRMIKKSNILYVDVVENPDFDFDRYYAEKHSETTESSKSAMLD